MSINTIASKSACVLAAASVCLAFGVPAAFADARDIPTKYGELEVNYAGTAASFEDAREYLKTVKVPATVNYRGKAVKVTTIESEAFEDSVATKVTVGKNVNKIEWGAFEQHRASSLTITLNSTKLTKKSQVSGCFQGSSATKITVKVTNASAYSAAKKIFTKANCGSRKAITVVKA